MDRRVKAEQRWDVFRQQSQSWSKLMDEEVGDYVLHLFWHVWEREQGKIRPGQHYNRVTPGLLTGRLIWHSLKYGHDWFLDCGVGCTTVDENDYAMAQRWYWEGTDAVMMPCRDMCPRLYLVWCDQYIVAQWPDDMDSLVLRFTGLDLDAVLLAHGLTPGQDRMLPMNLLNCWVRGWPQASTSEREHIAQMKRERRSQRAVDFLLWLGLGLDPVVYFTKIDKRGSRDGSTND